MTYVTKRQRKEIRKKKIRTIAFWIAGLMLVVVIGIVLWNVHVRSKNNVNVTVPEYTGKPYVEINNNKPFFTEKDLNSEVFEKYSELDYYGRCGVAYACLSKELMPEGERGEIGLIKPSGWQTVKYPEQIEDLYLYNRCHLIAWCLAGENDNEENLITGTRYMNVEGMLPFEEIVASYLDKTNNHVLYRVTPVYEGDNLVASGVLMEAYSIEDNGKGICFCVYCYNVQPGIDIDYATGESKVSK